MIRQFIGQPLLRQPLRKSNLFFSNISGPRDDLRKKIAPMIAELAHTVAANLPNKTYFKINSQDSDAEIIKNNIQKHVRMCGLYVVEPAHNCLSISLCEIMRPLCITTDVYASMFLPELKPILDKIKELDAEQKRKRDITQKLSHSNFIKLILEHIYKTPTALKWRMEMDDKVEPFHTRFPCMDLREIKELLLTNGIEMQVISNYNFGITGFNLSLKEIAPQKKSLPELEILWSIIKEDLRGNTLKIVNDLEKVMRTDLTRSEWSWKNHSPITVHLTEQQLAHDGYMQALTEAVSRALTSSYEDVYVTIKKTAPSDYEVRVGLRLTHDQIEESRSMGARHF